MNILLHVCCGPCLGKPGEILLDEGHRLNLFFFNPNIHPLQEFRKRLRAAEIMADRLKLSLQVRGDYGLERFLTEAVAHTGKIPNPEARCRLCFRMRLRAAAEEAKRQGLDAFSSTLLVSKRQRHELLRACGEEISQECGVPFYYRDFRSHFESAQELAKRITLYRQQYCGCIFSEQERFTGIDEKRENGNEKTSD